MTAQVVENFLQALFAGLTVGAIYGLMCVGLALIFGVMRVINFAQGEFMMLGMYAAFYIFTVFGVQAASSDRSSAHMWPPCWRGRCCSVPAMSSIRP